MWGFDFSSIPTGATIDKIDVQVLGYAAFAGLYDRSVSLLTGASSSGGTAAGTAVSGWGPWATGGDPATHRSIVGGTGTWGKSNWTTDDLQALGVLLSVNNTGSSNAQKAHINHIQVAVTYTEATVALDAVDNTYETAEDTALVVAAPGVLGNDAGATAVFSWGTPTSGTLSLTNGDGSFTYTPAPDFSGIASFTYTATDGTSYDTATVYVTVSPVNDRPVAEADTYTADEDTKFTVAAPGVLGNDTDADGDSLTAKLGTAPAKGSLTLDANGSFEYTPDANANGSDSFTYVANDGTVDSTEATVDITIAPLNDAPVAVGDTATTSEDSAVDIAVIGNDTDADDDNLSVKAGSLSTPTNGAVTMNPDGTVRYTPTTDFHGTDSFTYVATDGTADSSAATVNITVTEVNDPPEASDDSASVDEDDAAGVVVDVIGNDTRGPANESGQTITVVSVGTAVHGSAAIEGNKVRYTPNEANYNGADSFTYTIADNGTTNGAADPKTATAKVDITIAPVNDSPEAVDDDYDTNEDTQLTVSAPGVKGNDSDPDGDTFVVELVPGEGPSHGDLDLNTDGSFTYAPDEDYYGVDSFSYEASDGTADSLPATVDITVNHVNDAPVAAVDSATTAEDTAMDIDVLDNDTDVDGPQLSVRALTLSAPANGTAELNPDGTVRYTPEADFHGMDSFTYVATDGYLDSDTTTVDITVSPVNDPPVVVDDDYAADEDGALSVIAPGVLGNDSDVDGDKLNATVVAGEGPSHGDLTFNADGSFTYTPEADYTGSDSFKYYASDATENSSWATVTIAVAPHNDAPIAIADSTSTDEDVAIDVNVLANDTDAESDALSVSSVEQPAHGSVAISMDLKSVIYTPEADFNGADEFYYVAYDGYSNSQKAKVAVQVDAVNDAPVAADDDYETEEEVALLIEAPGVLGNDADVDASTILSAQKVTNPEHGELALLSTGAFIYTPDVDFVGVDSFTYCAFDGVANSAKPATVEITVTDVNDAPRAVDDTAVTEEDTAIDIDVLANDVDADEDVLSIPAGSLSAPLHGTVTIEAGKIRYTPAADFVGEDEFTYEASDGTTGSNAARVVVTVTEASDVPVSAGDSYATDEDTPLSVPARGVLDNDTDADGDTLTAVLVSGRGPAHGSLSLNEDGSFTYAPDEDFNGTDSFDYVANDGTADSVAATVDITVDPVNDAPVATDDEVSTDEDTPLTVTAPGILGNDMDVDDDTLTASIHDQPSHGALALSADGSFTYTPTGDYNGPDEFTYVASDGAESSKLAAVAITVDAVNDAPQGGADSAETQPNTAVTISVLNNDTDADGDTLTVVEPLKAAPTKGSAVINEDGTITYTPDASTAAGSKDSFSYAVTDGAAESGRTKVSISINEYTPPDAEPPATMLKAQPGEPDGVDGWYRNAPTVVLTSSERGETWYRWGSNGDFTEVPEDDDITAPEGTNTLYFYSVDEANNAEDPKTHEFKVDTVDPSTTTLSAEVISAGVVRLTWPAATDSGSGVYDYAVTKGDVVIAATTETNMDVDQLAADAVTTLRVVASDKAGNTSSSEGLNVTTQKLTEVATNATGLQEVGVTFERAWKPGKLNTNKLSRLQAPPPEGWTWDIPGKNGGRWRGAAWDVSTDVIFDSSSGFTITLAYDGNVLSREQELQLGLFHYEETSPGVWQWVQVPASVDTGPNLIRGVGHSFSDWAVFGPAGMVGEEDNGGGGPVVSTPASSVWSLGLLGFVGLALAALTRRRRFARR